MIIITRFQSEDYVYLLLLLLLLLAYNCIRAKFQHLRLHSYTDVAKLFNECSDYKELANFRYFVVNQGVN
jgi:hypothetical protein